MIVILHESKSMFRQIYMDGRTLQPDAPPTWLGYSTGKWEGDVLVVRTAGFNDKTWLDDNGHPHSESLVVTERFRRPDFGHLFVDITIEDPIAYRSEEHTSELQSRLHRVCRLLLEKKKRLRS